MSEVAVVGKPYTVGTKIPYEWKELLEKNVIGADKEYTSFSEYVRDLIRNDMKRRGLFQSHAGDENEGKN